MRDVAGRILSRSLTRYELNHLTPRNFAGDCFPSFYDHVDVYGFDLHEKRTLPKLMSGDKCRACPSERIVNNLRTIAERPENPRRKVQGHRRGMNVRELVSALKKADVHR